MTYQLRFSSDLPVPPSEAWAWIISVDGIAREMSPFFRMSMPQGLGNLPIDNIQLGEPLFRSWIKLFNLIPIDYSDLTLTQLELGQGFVEESTMGSMRVWRHTRTISPREGGCSVTDELVFDPKFAAGLVRAGVKAFFQHRHRMLRKHLRED